jgi:Tol biopolymer transport system component
MSPGCKAEPPTENNPAVKSVSLKIAPITPVNSLPEVRGRFTALWLLLVCLIGSSATRAAQAGNVSPVRVESAAADCHDPGVSANGRFVVFVSQAGDLAPNDSNGTFDVFVRDRVLGKTILASVNHTGVRSGNGPSVAASISADGRLVVFESSASDLVAGDTNNTADIFARDLIAGTTTLVSVATNGVSSGNGPSSWPAMTPDGRFILFESRASSLALNDLNNASDLFVRDLAARATTLVTRDRLGNFSAAGGELTFSDTARISDDGRWVAFSSSATNLVANDSNLKRDVFVRDLLNRTNLLVSVNTNRVAGNNISGSPALSADGRFVAFQSLASDLVANDSNKTNDVFVRDLVSGTTTLVSLDQAGAFSGTNSSFSPAISADGRYVAFQSLAGDLVGNDNLPTSWVPALDVFVRDLLTGTTLMASAHSAQALLDSTYYTNWTTATTELRALPLSISRDGRFVLFQSDGEERTLTLSNGGQAGSTTVAYLPGAFVFDRTSGTRTRIKGALFPALSDDGRVVVFQAAANQQLTNEPSPVVNVFARDLANGSTEWISRHNRDLDRLTGGALSQLTPGSISANGRFLAYESFSADLAANDTNGTSDIFVRDLITGSNEWVSANYLADVSDSGGIGFSNVLISLAPARLPVISHDGRRVAFEAVVRMELGTNGLSPQLNGLNNQLTLCVYDRFGRTNRLIASIGPTNRSSAAANPVWSGDGRYLAFRSSGEAVPNGSIGQVFFRDLTQDTNVLVSRALNPFALTGGSKASWNPLISADGARVLFLSAAADLGTNAVSGTNLFLWDASSGNTTLLSASPTGGGLNRVSQPALSAAGRFATFLNQTNLYLCDLVQLSLSLVVSNAAAASLSAEGRFIAFESTDGLAANDTNALADVYALDRTSGAIVLASVNLDGTASGRGKSTAPLLSPDGRYVVFTSQAPDLVANDTNGFTDVFLRDLTAGTTWLLSANSTHSASGNRLSANPVLSADGNVVVFESYSSDLTVGDFNEAKDIFFVRLSAGDADGDGMADDWEVAYFGGLARDGTGDFDNDGQSDLSEFRAGTNPTADQSIFRALTLASPNVADGVIVMWNAVPGRAYRVQYKNGIADPDWKELPGDVVATSANAIKLDSAPETAARFYRVMFLP